MDFNQYHLAIDIGASGGRHILGRLENKKLQLKEIYRFENGMTEQNGQLCWDIDSIFSQILHGMKLCKDIGKLPVSVGLDTWGVDFVLLDINGQRIGDTVGYRDKRTVGMDKVVEGFINCDELYSRTGIQKLSFNTIYQLMALKLSNPEQLATAEHFLTIPDYLYYRLTGKLVNEYTNATTTQLISVKTGKWDYELIEMLGYPKKIFGELSQPASLLGPLSKNIQETVGYNCDVILCATHDTASAVMATPLKDENSLYISSGTWSLMGTELSKPDSSGKSRLHNFTNEGGYGGRIRYLKNIMGLWMIQSLRRELKESGESYSFDKLCELAESSDIASIVDCTDERFTAPNSMIYEVKSVCMGTGQTVPQTVGELAAVIYKSLAVCYKKTAEELKSILGTEISTLHIIGGGANADYLNRLTAKACETAVYAGPVEATAIGNLLAQFLAFKDFKNIDEGRRCVAESFQIKKYAKE